MLGLCSLTADALHALTDLVADIMTLATISYSLRPATKLFPMGYGKIESLGALGVSGFLLTGGFMIGYVSKGIMYCDVISQLTPGCIARHL